MRMVREEVEEVGRSRRSGKNEFGSFYPAASSTVT